MDGVLEKAAVKRVAKALLDHQMAGQIKVLTDSARSAAEAASALGIEVRTVLAKVQAVAGITRTLTCPVTTF